MPIPSRTFQENTSHIRCTGTNTAIAASGQMYSPFRGGGYLAATRSASFAIQPTVVGFGLGTCLTLQKRSRYAAVACA